MMVFNIGLLVSQTKQRWSSGDAPDANHCLRQHDDLSWTSSAILDLAYEEYCQRQEAGERIDVDEFLARFPTIMHSLGKQIQVHEYMDQHPSLVSYATGDIEFTPGERIFKFAIREQLGQGAFARVYLCSEEDVGGRQVVVKISNGKSYEADYLGRLAHESITPVFSVKHEPETGLSCISMPFAGRSTLLDVLDMVHGDARAPRFEASAILRAATRSCQADDQYDVSTAKYVLPSVASYSRGIALIGVRIADALEHAHQQGIVHGDLKPSNVLLTPHAHPMLLDFNLSQSVRSELPVPCGTLPYMAPEQLKYWISSDDSEQCVVDPRTDIYALGVILYELLCGELPNSVPKPDASPAAGAALLLQQKQSGHRTLLDRCPQLDPSLAKVIDDCLQFERATRTSTAGDLRDALTAFLENENRRDGRAKMIQRSLAAAIALILVLASSAAFFHTAKPTAEKAYLAGTAKLRDGESAEALKHFDQAVQLDSTSQEYLFARGLANLRNKYIRFALDDFYAANKISEDSAIICCQAYCLQLLGQHKEAAMLYRKALKLGYDGADIRNNLGYACLLQGELVESQQCFNQAIVLNPDSQAARLNRAVLDLRYSDLDSDFVPLAGMDDITKAIDLGPVNGKMYYIAARLFGFGTRHDQQFAKQSIDFLQKALHEGVRLKAAGAAADPAFARLYEDHQFQKLLGQTPTTKQSRALTRIEDVTADLLFPNLE